MKQSTDDWIYGINPVLEALKAGGRIKSIHISSGRHRTVPEIIQAAEKTGIHVTIENEDFFNKTFPKGHQGVAARISQKGYVELGELLKIPSERNEPAFFLIMDCIEDPQNLGAILRTAETAGVHGIIIQSHRAAGLSPAVYKSSAGAVEYMPVAQVSNIKHAIDLLKKTGVWIYGADMQAKETLWDTDLRGPVAIVLGSEGSGLRKTVREHCDYLLRIPLKGRVSSLNVSVASALIVFEALRQRTR
ncbi:MAG: 23S rRNA (guanosine(2251)-2'-O)-methyltransferase RlmB [Nitrospirae bacterium]|nr:23S rRNA (guanosine(2251)-2'-O)-methyltransferase RlmB [Nitrospirota bacterium]